MIFDHEIIIGYDDGVRKSGVRVTFALLKTKSMSRIFENIKSKNTMSFWISRTEFLNILSPIQER